MTTDTIPGTPPSQDATPAPLSGLRVVDFGRDFVAAVASLVLADFGAEVVKIEPPEGDLTRAEPAWCMWHRGKKSIVLDLDDPVQCDQARRLAAGADIVLVTLPPDRVTELGLDYESVSRDNSALVYASVSALGERGKYRHLPVLDAVPYARNGSMYGRATVVARPGPSLGPLPYAAYAAAQNALQGILAALYVREKCGRGQHVRATLAQALCSQDPWEWLIAWLAKQYPDAYVVTPALPEAGSPISHSLLTLLTARTRDGYWVQFAQYSPHLWRAFMKALDMEQVIVSNPEFAPAPYFEEFEPSMKFWKLLIAKIGEHSLVEWQEYLRAHQDVGMEVFRYPEEALDHPQLVHNGTIIDFDDPRVGKTRQLGPVIQMFGTPAAPVAPAPELGRHTEEVLGRLAAGEWQPPRIERAGPVPARPLAGVTLVELAMYYAAPYGPAILADLGARVIHVELPRGDDIRRGMPINESGGVKVTQGKESLAVDLGTPEGRQIVHGLVKQADLVMTSYRGDVNRRLGIDYETFRRLNPSLVYVDAPGYGIDGPCAHQPAYAPTMTAAVGGTMFQLGAVIPPRSTEYESVDAMLPVIGNLFRGGGGPGNGDGLAANTVATSLLLGLLTRERFGIGQETLTAMIGSNALAASADMLRYAGKWPARTVDAERYGFDALERVYEANEGWIFLAATYEEGWRALCRLVERCSGGKIRLAAEPRFATRANRLAHDRELAELLTSFFLERTAAEWEQLGIEGRVPCITVEQWEQPPLFAIEDPIMHENGFVDEVDHPLFGPHPRLGPLVQFSLTPGVSKPGCLIGQHTEPILTELGYSPEQIADLEQRGIVFRG